MANTGISVPDDVLEDFDRILDVKEMMDELETDERSPVIADLMRQYVEDNQEYLERWEAFVEGNRGRRTSPMAAD